MIEGEGGVVVDFEGEGRGARFAGVEFCARVEGEGGGELVDEGVGAREEEGPARVVSWGTARTESNETNLQARTKAILASTVAASSPSCSTTSRSLICSRLWMMFS